jgi:Flp pilus assembly protein TadD
MTARVPQSGVPFLLVLTVILSPSLLQAGSVTYAKDIAPIIYAHCAPCHRPGEAAPFSLLTYEDVGKRARFIADVTKKRYMPPWSPEPGYGDFKNSSRLSDQQIALIAAWVQANSPQGDPADLPPAPHFTEGWQLGKPDLILRMSKPYPLPSGGSDVFRNFVLPANITETRYVRAFELRPGNKRIVHHANVVLDRSRLLRKRDGQDGQPGFGGMDVETEGTGEFDPDSHFLFWKPGTPAQEEPADMAWRLDPGNDLVLNLHLQPSGKPEIVDAELGLYFTSDPPGRHPMLLQLEHDGAINIPPNTVNFAVTDHLKLPISVDVLAVYPHAHYLGKQIEAWADLPNGTRLSLIKINRWDINWQATYTYRDPVKLPAGTTIAMRIGYDNTSANPRNPNHPPITVRTGNRSVDEMGHVWLQVLPNEPTSDDARLILQQAYMRRRIEKYPTDFLAHFNLGAALQSQGHPEEALKPLTEAVRIRPDSATALNNLAADLFAMERFSEAAVRFRQALQLDPTYQNARYNLARTLTALGDAPSAISELDNHLKQNPDDADAHEFLGRLLVSNHNLQSALLHFQRAAMLDPGNAGFLINLGAALASTGNPSAAVSAFEQALKLDPTSTAARDNLNRVRHILDGKRP